jgi:hypothetical protein
MGVFRGGPPSRFFSEGGLLLLFLKLLLLLLSLALLHDIAALPLKVGAVLVALVGHGLRGAGTLGGRGQAGAGEPTVGALGLQRTRQDSGGLIQRDIKERHEDQFPPQNLATQRPSLLK